MLVACPWLNPLVFGPTPQAVPWLVTLACVLPLFLLCGDRPGGLSWAWPGTLAALVGTCALAWFSGAAAPQIVYLAMGLVVIGLAAASGGRSGHARALQGGLLLAATLAALGGLAQYFGLAAWLSPVLAAAEPGTAYSNLRQANQYATLCWLGVAVLVFGTLRLKRSRAIPVALLLGVGCAASASRTGMVEALVLVVLAAWWGGFRRGSPLIVVIAAVGAYLLAASALPILLEQFAGADARRLWARLAGGDGCSSRLVLWSNVLHLLALKPWTGWGWGNLDLAHYLALYPGPRFCDILDNAHNLPLHLAVELGVPVALAFCIGAAAWVWRQRPWAEQVPVRQLAWALLALLLVHSLLEYPLWYGPFQMALGLCIAWLLPAGDPARGPISPLVRPAVAVVVSAALAYAAWDYVRISQIYLPPAARVSAWREDALAHARRSWLFSGQARFAEVTLAEPSRANAAWLHEESRRALRYSPEPRVIERLIESALHLGLEDEALLHLARYRAAFPQEHAQWQQRQRESAAR